MNWSGIVYIGWQHLRHRKWRTVLLVGVVTMLLALPLVLLAGVRSARAHLQSRAADTPLIVGPQGSALDLTLRALYFQTHDDSTISLGRLREIDTSGLAYTIPLDVRFSTGEHTIVGTTLDYFDLRGIKVNRGHWMGRLGDCVVGATAARRLKTEPGGFLVSSPDSMVGLAGGYPLRMRVCGVLASTGSVDDECVFVDIKTAWIIAGLAHGHEDADSADASVVADRKDGETVFNAAVRSYREITDSNANSFHFHGDPEGFPVSAGIVVPSGDKSAALLMGRYAGEEKPAMLLRPREVMDDLFKTVFRVRDLVLVGLLLVGLAALALLWLVFRLSARLREGEMASLEQIGTGKSEIRVLRMFEACFVVGVSVVCVLVVVSLVFLGGEKLVTMML